jgi:hypothetical protein
LSITHRIALTTFTTAPTTSRNAPVTVSLKLLAQVLTRLLIADQRPASQPTRPPMTSWTTPTAARIGPPIA